MIIDSIVIDQVYSLSLNEFYAKKKDLMNGKSSELFARRDAEIILQLNHCQR